MPEDQSLRVALPDSLRRQFADLEKRLFSLETRMALSAALIALLAVFLVFFVSDRFWDTPVWLRLTFALTALLGIVAAALWWLDRWVFRRRDLKQLALLVQSRYRRLGDRLLGIVELADEMKRPPNFSPELYRAAIDQVSADASKYNFPEAISGRTARLEVMVTAALIFLVFVPALLLPQASWNAFRRWIAPTASIPRFTLVELAGLSAEQVVPHGENFQVQGKVRYRSFWHPDKVKGLISGQPSLTTRVTEGELALNVPGQVEDGVLQVRVGDARAEVALSPKHRPGLETIRATVRLPEYLGYPEQTQNPQGGVLTLVEGSHFSLQAQATRNLDSATLNTQSARNPELAQVETPGQRPVITSGSPKSSDLKVKGRSFTTPLLSVDEVSRLSFTWRDDLGLTNAAPWSISISSQKDQPPAPEFAELFRDMAILESEVLPVRTRARDDFGVKQLGLEWRTDLVTQATNEPPRRDFLTAAETTSETNLESTFNFSPSVLSIPPDTTVELQAYAVDYLPGREKVFGPTYRIHVLGNSQHAEMIRQNLESLLVRLEEVTRLEEKIASETRDLRDLQKLDTPESEQKISDLERAQDQNAAQLKELAEEGMRMLREALRNPVFSESLLTEWTRDLHQMQQLSDQEMQQASSSLNQAAQNQQNREQNLADAAQKQEEIIKQLQQMQQEVNESLDELQALTLAQRLRQVGKDQEKLEKHLQAIIADTVGLLPQELPERYQKANSLFAEMQMESQGESEKLQGEISRFYERTQKMNYGTVSQQMQDSRPVDELDRVRGLIQENIAMEAMDNLSLWATRFDGWADLLEPPPSESSSGGSGQGQGQGEQDDRALKQLLALIRMREGQVNIQERTRLLHDYIEDQRTHRDGAVLLAASQGKLNRDLTRQAVDNSFAMLDQTYNDAINVMSDVESLLDKPQTDQVTRGEQEKSVNTLTDLINLLNEEAKKQNSSSSGQQQQQQQGDEMAFLMQMMAPQLAPGMQPGQTAGGNMAGGGTDKPSAEVEGDVSGKTGDGRAVGKASGVPQNYPTEFRPALEKYFRALEQKQP